MDLIVANARQLSSLHNELYEWQTLDAVYARLTANLLTTLTPLWAARGPAPVNGWITEAQIKAGAAAPANRFFPSLDYGPNPRNWNELKPFNPPILQGYALPDSSPATGSRNAQIADMGATLYQWINARLHRSEGTLQRIALLTKGLAIADDSLEINSMLADAFSE